MTEVRKLNPPKLEAKNLGTKILCHRAMRRGSPNMSVELWHDKVLINNYSHGGSGWTLGPGSVDYVYGLLVTSEYASGFTSDTPVTILGAGVIGLYTAYDLLKKGFRNITIVASHFNNLTSHYAGGIVAPISMDNAPHMQPAIDRIGTEAYKYFKDIALGNNPDFPNGATIVPTYFDTREESGLEPYVGVVMDEAKDVVLDYGNGARHEMVAYDDGIFINTPQMMQYLKDYVYKFGVKTEHRKIISFDELGNTYIFNCSGMGSIDLLEDPQIISIQGHLIMLKGQNPKDLDYMVMKYLGHGKTADNFPIERALYIFPKINGDEYGVIGGSFVEGATKNEPNEAEFEVIIKNARDFFGI